MTGQPSSIAVQRSGERRVPWRIAVFLAIAVSYLSFVTDSPEYWGDGASYTALAHSLVHGRGYTRSLIAGFHIPHTTYPPGLPILLVPAVVLGGDPINWALLRITLVLCGLAGIAAAWQLAFRLTDDKRLADATALLVATMPIYWQLSHEFGAEAPLFAWIFGGLWFIDRLWAKRRPGGLESFLVGSVCGLGMLIKGTVVGLALVPLAYLGGSRRSTHSPFRHAWIWAVFCTGFAVAQLAWMARNRGIVAHGYDGLNQARMVLHRDSMNASSGAMSIDDLRFTVVENLRRYVIYRIPAQMIPGCWHQSIFNWSGSGILALSLTLGLTAWAVGTVRWNTLPLHIVAWSTAALMLPMTYGGIYARYWGPITVLLSCAILLQSGQWLRKGSSRRCRIATASLVFILLVNSVLYVETIGKWTLRANDETRKLDALFQRIARQPEKPGAVLSPSPLTFRLSTGVTAPLVVEGSEVPLFTHSVGRLDGKTPKPPEGGRIVLEEPPWCYFEMPAPVAHQSLHYVGLAEQERFPVPFGPRTPAP